MAKVEKVGTEKLDPKPAGNPEPTQLTAHLKSKVKLVKPIPWDTVINLDKIMYEPNLYLMHKQRIDKIFQKESDEVKNRQLQNILIRDTIFNFAMTIIAQCFEFELDETEVNNLIPVLKTGIPQLEGMSNEMYEAKIQDIATKLIQKQLMFEKIAADENITVSDEETKKVLDDYYAATNMPIGEFLRDPQKFESAKRTLFEEKVTVYIIEKFPRNMDKLYENMQKDIEAQQANEKKSS